MKRSRASSSGICRARKLSGSQPYRTLPTSKTTAVAGKASALARLEAAVGLVDDVGAAPAADHAAVAVARLEGLERVADLHGLKRLPVFAMLFSEMRGAHLVRGAAQVKPGACGRQGRLCSQGAVEAPLLEDRANSGMTRGWTAPISRFSPSSRRIRRSQSPRWRAG